MNVLVAGGSGFVGRELVAALLERGDHVTVVTRDPSRARRGGLPGASYRGWLPDLDAYDAVVNLAGESIFSRRWNRAFQRRLVDSRLQTTRVLVQAVQAAARPPGVLVNASAIGVYGDRGEEPLAEDATGGDDFLARLCRDWEAEACRAATRTVRLRIGVVLGPEGGALAAMGTPFRLGLGGPIGRGRQWFSWVHRSDVAGLILWSLDRDDLSGPVNATAPGVVRNAAFARALGRALHRPALLPTPRLALRLALGRVAEVLCASQRCVPRAALEAGYAFRFPELSAALEDVTGR